jgi:hypothetical protein
LKSICTFKKRLKTYFFRIAYDTLISFYWFSVIVLLIFS